MADNNISKQSDRNTQARAERSLLVTMGVVVAAAAIIAIIGFVFLNRPDNIIEGQVEGTNVRISGKLPGRVTALYVSEGDSVHAGDTLVYIHSSIVDAKLTEVEAMQEAARAQNRKVDAGTRQQIISGAYELLQQAKAASSIARKTYERMERLYAEGVISEQKRDEAKAAYDAAVAGQRAAESQYSLARSGAQAEDKQSTAALVQAAGGGVSQVKAVLEDSYLTAPFDGVIDEIYPEVGELVAMGSPIMNLLRNDRRWITFNVREELLNDLTMGKEIDLMIPALGCRDIKAEIYYIRDMGSYATWRSTKATGEWDSRTFMIKARPTSTDDARGLLPGMTAVLRK